MWRGGLGSAYRLPALSSELRRSKIPSIENRVQDRHGTTHTDNEQYSLQIGPLHGSPPKEPEKQREAQTKQNTNNAAF
jgi:hypothetical protein